LIGLFVILLLLKNKSLNQSRFFLAAMLFFLILHLETLLLFTTKLIQQQPHLLGISYPTLFLLGPSFYFFIKTFNHQPFTFRKWDAIHVLPFLLVFVIQIPFYFESTAYKLRVIDFYYQHLPEGSLSLLEWFRNSIQMLLLFFYTIISLILLSRKDEPNGVISKRIAGVLIALSVSSILLHTGFLLSGASAIVAEIVLASLLAICILVLGYWIVDINFFFVKKSGKYETSPLSDSALEKIEYKLQETITHDKLYLKSQLKIKDVSVITKIPSHHISQVLNSRMEKNFFDFINGYRIEEAKSMLSNGRASKLSLEAVGEECGFNNKTSFYRAFKKYTGYTPNEYLKNN